MNSQSKLLLVIGIFVLTENCLGQQPISENTIMHFAADIITVDSILSASSFESRQSTSNNHPHSLPCDKDNIRFELNKGKSDGKVEFICPRIPEMDRPKKI